MTTKKKTGAESGTSDQDRLRALVDQLEQLIELPGQTAVVNPDGTPGTVVAGELIESAWGNATANTITRFAQADADLDIPILGNVDAAAAGFTNWLVGGISVPSWVTKARVVTTVAGLYQASGAPSAFELQASLGAAAGIVAYVQPVAINNRYTVTWNDVFAVTTTGTLNLSILARRTIGDGVLRADTSTRCRFLLRYDW
jgi:hypothetical protein